MAHTFNGLNAVPSTGQYWDPTGSYEAHNTVYTLLVFTPPRPPSKYIPSIFTREPVHASPYHFIRPSNGPASTSQDYSHYEGRDLDEMRTRTVKIKSWRFPAELRCEHVQRAGATGCDQGCYVLEKGGEWRRWVCGREDCDGHVYCGNVKDMDTMKGEKNVSCFGKKGERLVCIK